MAKRPDGASKRAHRWSKSSWSDTIARYKIKKIASYALRVTVTRWNTSGHRRKSLLQSAITEIRLASAQAGESRRQLNLMRAFLQGAVFCWCKNRKYKRFAARDLLGGDNHYWQGTPLIPLYDHYLNDDEEIHRHCLGWKPIL